MHRHININWGSCAVKMLFFLSTSFLVCGTAWASTLQGTAMYRERIDLPFDAVFEVELRDVSKADAPALVLGRAKLDPAGPPPFRFVITYDDATLQAGHRYTVRATVKQQGRLLFTTDRHYPVLNGDNKPIQLQLVAVGGSAKPHAAITGIGSLPASFEGELPGADSAIKWHIDLLPEGRYQLRTTYVSRIEPNSFDDIGRWVQERDTGRIVLRGGREAPVFLMPAKAGAALRMLDLDGKPIESSHNDSLARLPKFLPIEPRLNLTGMFRYKDNADSIILCVNSQHLPVAMEGDYKALITAARQSGEQLLLVSIEGLIVQRPSTEQSLPLQDILVVERLISTWPRESCANTQTKVKH